MASGDVEPGLVQAFRWNRRHEFNRDVRPRPGWGIPIAPPTLMITVGGIATKPRYVNGTLEPRELLDVTISVDHDLVDGAPAARFARSLAELLENADALTSPARTRGTDDRRGDGSVDGPT